MALCEAAEGYDCVQAAESKRVGDGYGARGVGGAGFICDDVYVEGGVGGGDSGGLGEAVFL